MAEKLFEKRNELIGRSEFKLLIIGEGGTPSRPEALDAISKQLGIEKNRLSLVSIKPRYGSPGAIVSVRAYDSPETLSLFEPRYRLVRTGILQLEKSKTASAG